MAQTVMRVYDKFDNAQRARQALLDSGFTDEAVDLEARGDEAGPVDGNAVVDTKDTGHGPRARSGIAGMLGAEERTDAYNNSEPDWGATYQLTVAAGDDRQCAVASDIMDRYGAIDVDALTARNRSGGRSTS